MIKAKAKFGHLNVAILGLTRDNWERLTANEPIMFQGADMGLNVDRVLILGGESVDDIKKDLRALGLAV